MEAAEGQQKAHPSRDQALTLLSGIDGPIGEFVIRFPGKEQLDCSPRWLEDWFVERAKFFLSNPSQSQVVVLPDEIQDLVNSLQEGHSATGGSPARLLNIRPNYFRGFRRLENAVNLDGALVVVEGRNSSGKTSLAEGLEWLFTGQLSRRTIHEMGNARELENCIANQFRLDGEETWVEAEFALKGGETLRLRRVLKCDYGTTQSSSCQSSLFLNGQELSQKDGIKAVEHLFAGVPPLLMQHTLREFVHSCPSDRRAYFERLLRLDEITHLIEKAVVGNTRFAEFPSASNSLALRRWEAFKSQVRQPASKTALKRAEKDPEHFRVNLVSALTLVAAEEFSGAAGDKLTFDSARQFLLAQQQVVRQESFPLLGKLRPRRAIDQRLVDLFYPDGIRELGVQVETAFDSLTTVKKATELIGDAQIAIARAFALLKESNLISATSEPQQCPLCAYPDTPTLTGRRVENIGSWVPAQAAVSQAKQNLRDTLGRLRNWLESAREARGDLLPNGPSGEEWAKAAEGITDATVLEEAVRLRAVSDRAVQALASFDSACGRMFERLGTECAYLEALTQVGEDMAKLNEGASTVIEIAQEYATRMAALESAVGSLAREDPDYNRRGLWIEVADDLDNLVSDLEWEQAKSKAQAELKSIRDGLIALRQALLEARRLSFSGGMNEVWKALRADTYSSFSQLFIPEPRGKGFPVEIEVKALLDNGIEQKEVDALKVFSESQVHALGISAFVTRSVVLGHRLLIFDDPVQSMDEEHFKTFAGALTSHLLAQGFQVVILTHNDVFARDLGYVHFDCPGYVTLAVRSSKRKGCQLQEGNRRVGERLKLAIHCAEEGKLEDAWRLVRLSIERLYTVVRAKYGPSGFDPHSWSGLTAEDMWNQGAGTIIESTVPGSGRQLKEILVMTAGGAHDKPTQGLTDLSRAAECVRELLPQLRIGG